MKNLKTKRMLLIVLLVLGCFFWAQEIYANGSDWAIMETDTTDYMSCVWGSSATDVFVVGEYRTIWHYDGSDWTSTDYPNSGPFLGVWGSSSADVFAVGQFGEIAHFDGSHWTIMANFDIYFRDVWGSGSNDVFAVGWYGTILHYDGSNWTEMDSGTANRIDGIWGASGNDVFAVGDNGTILHYDGSTWSSMSSGTSKLLFSIWGSSSSDVFAVGPNGTVLHYDGNNWSLMNSNTVEPLHSVWGSSGTDVFAVGRYGTIFHYDGNEWTAMNSGSYSYLLGVWGSSGSDIFVVGDNGTILHYPAQRYNVTGNWAVTSIDGFGTYSYPPTKVTSGQVTVGVSVTGEIEGEFDFVCRFYPGEGENGTWYGTSASVSGTVTVDGVDHPATLWLKGYFDTFNLVGFPPTGWEATLSCPQGDTHGWTTDGSEMMADFGWTGACSGSVTWAGGLTGSWWTSSGTGLGTWDGVSNTCLAGKTEYTGSGAGQVSLPMSPEEVTLDYDMSEDGDFILARYDSNPGSMPDTRHILSRFVQVDSSVISPETNWESVELQIEYTDAEITGATLNENTLALYWWGSSSGQWEKVSGSWVNPEENFVTGSLDHFSIYSIQGDPLVIYSCDDMGIPKDEFDEGESVYVTGSGLVPDTDYHLWVQSAGITEGAELIADNDLSEAQELVTTDSNGNFEPVEIWEILGLDFGEYEFSIVADNQASGAVGTFNAADDELDSVMMVNGLADKLITWDGKLVADFGNARGLYCYATATDWDQLIDLGDVNQMLEWNDGSNINLVVDFRNGLGLRSYDGTTWTPLTDWDDVAGMTTWGNNLAVDFGNGRGVFNYNGTWTKITTWDTANAMGGWNDGTTDHLVMDFGDGRGTYSYNGTAWNKMTSWCDVEHMTVYNDGSDDILAVDFGSGRGLFTYDGIWHKITSWDTAQNMIACGSNLAVDFGAGRGVFYYNGTWTKITSWDSTNDMTEWNDGATSNLVVDFGNGSGLKVYNGTWSSLSGLDSTVKMLGFGTDLGVDFGPGAGVSKYSGSTWTKINDWSTAD